MAGGVLFFDLAPSLCGYCVGDGLSVPVCSAWEFPPLGTDLGALGRHMAGQARALIRQHRPDRVGYESPILLPHDALADVRRIFGLGMVLEVVCQEDEFRQPDGEFLPCGEADLRRMKSIITGNPHAEKPAVAKIISDTLCIPLPRTVEEGRHDASDAASGWLLTMSEFFPEAAAPWLARLGGLLL